MWYPKQPPVCISKTTQLASQPLDDMMCLAPDDVAYASYRAVEVSAISTTLRAHMTKYDCVQGVVTPNGALHGTILEYSCNIGYRDTILPCLPRNRDPAFTTD